MTGTFPHPIRLAMLLAFGVAVIAPLIGWGFVSVGLSLTVSLFIAIMVVGLGYAAIALYTNVITALTVSFVVLISFAANVPLAAETGALPGGIGPQIFLFEGPLVLLATLFVARGWYSLDSFSVPEFTFGAFVVWSAVVAIAATPEQPAVAWYYTLYMAVAWITFTVAIRVVRHNVMKTHEMAGAFLVGVVANTVVAAAQVVHGGAFGLSVLGETARTGTIQTLDLGTLGSYATGIAVSGYVGGNGTLAAVIVMAFPIAFAYIVVTRSYRRIGLAAALLMIAVCFLTLKDAARGGLLLVICLFGLAWLRSDQSAPQVTRRSMLACVGGGVAMIAVVIGMVMAGVIDLATLSVRLDQYRVALSLLGDHPVVGIGGANFPYVAADILQTRPSSNLTHPIHNLYLSTFTGTGIVGGMLLIATLMAVARAGWHSCWPARSRPFALAVFVGFVGWLTMMMLLNPHQYGYVMPPWLLAGVVVGTHDKISRQSRFDRSATTSSDEGSQVRSIP